MRLFYKDAHCGAYALSIVLFASVAWADDVHYAPFKPSSAKPTPAEITETDHEAIRLRAGLGYFGFVGAPLGKSGARDELRIHQLGARVWFRRNLGFDFALGGAVSTGSGPTTFGVAARASLPIALLVDKHVTVFTAPSLGYSLAGETIPSVAAVSPITGAARTPPDTHHRGMSFTLGAHVGAEVHFGFLGITRLALVGAIGLEARHARTQTNAAGPPTTLDPDPRATTTRSQRTSVAVSGNFAIVYYF